MKLSKKMKRKLINESVAKRSEEKRKVLMKKVLAQQ